MLFVLCYPDLDEEDRARIEAFRRLHEPARASLVPAHVTLVFGVSTIAPDSLVALAAQTAAATPPFALSLTGTEAYTDPVAGDYKLFLMVDRGADALTRLHKRLYTGPLVQEQSAGFPFRPHMTVATASSPEPIRNAASQAARLLPVRASIAALTVTELRHGTMETIAELRLG